MFNDSVERRQILEGSKVSSGCISLRASRDDCLHSGNISNLDYHLLFDMWHAYLYKRYNKYYATFQRS